MRRYDDPVEVRRGEDGPEQFLWRDRLWQVRTVQASWVETGPWWATRQARETIGSDDAPTVGSPGAGSTLVAAPVDLLGERELWRVEASRGAFDAGGVFDLSFDWSDGGWRLVGCLD